LFSKTENNSHPFHHESWIDGRFPKITQDGRDGDDEPGYIANIRDGAIAGFKYFDFETVNRITVKTRGYAHGHLEVKTSWDGKTLAKIPINSSNIWTESSAFLDIPYGTFPLYLEYKGEGATNLLSFTLQ
jgi:hypothetical protein